MFATLPQTVQNKLPHQVWLSIILLAYIFLAAGCHLGTSPSSERDSNKISYNDQIRPILSDNCFACHGPDANTREAGLRLDNASDATAALRESPGKHAIIPGKPNKSELVRRIHHEDAEEQMPPANSKLTLSASEKALLEQWIEEGATYDTLWSFLPPKAIEPPDLNDDWIQNEIDAFVLTRLQEASLKPSARASSETLIRRAAFDLTGLPPTLQQLDQLLNDDSQEAFTATIDELLATPAYGERMASWWLDIARYADSDGYLDDKHRTFYPWRDWVIQAFNENLSYKDFVTWQLAGDLLPDATQEQVLATAFNRLHKKNSEAGIVFEEFRVEYVADRTNTFGKAFLGLTLECARCHDHKYDPISQKEYYQLFGFFNSTNEIGHAVYGPDQTPGPALLLTSDAQELRIDSLKTEIEKLEQQLQAEQSQQTSSFDEWIDTGITSSQLAQSLANYQTAYYPFDEVIEKINQRASSLNLASPKTPALITEPVLDKGIKEKALVLNDYNKAQLGEKVGWFGRTDPFTIDFWLFPDTLYKEAMVFTHSEEWRLGLRGYMLQLEDNKPVFRMAHSYPQNALRVRAVNALPADTWSHLSITYDGSSTGKGIQIALNGIPMDLVVEVDNLYKGILFTPDIHTYGFQGIFFGQRDKFTPFKKGRIDEFQVFNRELTALEIRYLHDPSSVEEALESNQQSTEIRRLLKDYYAEHIYEPAQVIKAKLKETRAALNDLLNTVPEIMVMGDLPETRETHVLERGLYDAPGESVVPSTPAAVLAFNKEYQQNRIGLTDWLFDENNPLTARVIVNRVWQMHFGRGLVSTTDDFGNQGAQPSHPELLDWLAVWFRASNWDIKALHRLIIHSSTYQQSSVMRDSLLNADPENIFLARGPAFRLSAEMIRDNALAISGLLSSRLGGESVYPYQPAGLWDELTTKSWRYPYKQEPGEGLYRRSLYTIWKRTAPPPSMLIFDAPDRSTCTVERTNTSTPLQALALMNDPQYVEAARVLASTVLKKHSDISEALTEVFRLTTSRHPTAEEQSVLAAFFEAEYDVFSTNTQAARQYLQTGESVPDNSLPPDRVAALAVVVNALMNTDEGYMRR